MSLFLEIYSWMGSMSENYLGLFANCVDIQLTRNQQISRLILRCCSIIPLSLLITYYFCIIMSFCLNSRLPAAEGSDPVSCFYWLQKERKKLLQFSPKRFNLLTCKYRTSQVGAGFFVVLTVTCVQPHID